MAWEHREGQGSLFNNKYKEKDNHPDFTGEIMINDVVYKLSGWKKRSSSGTSYVSLSAQEKKAPVPATSLNPIDDEIAF